MSVPGLDNPGHKVKKWVIVFQPSLRVGKMGIAVDDRNKAGHGFAPFCNQDFLFAMGYLADQPGKTLLGVSDVHDLLVHQGPPFFSGGD